MKSKSIYVFFLLSVAFSTYATSTKYLDSYEAIKNHLLKGGEIKVIIDSKNDCKLVSQSGPVPYSPNTYSINAKQFILKAKNGNIEIPIYFDFNSAETDLNVPPNYHTIDMSISPQGQIKVEEKGISLLDYKVAVSFVTACVIGNENQVGAKFIPYQL